MQVSNFQGYCITLRSKIGTRFFLFDSAAVYSQSVSPLEQIVFILNHSVVKYECVNLLALNV